MSKKEKKFFIPRQMKIGQEYKFKSQKTNYVFTRAAFFMKWLVRNIEVGNFYYKVTEVVSEEVIPVSELLSRIGTIESYSVASDKGVYINTETERRILILRDGFVFVETEDHEGEKMKLDTPFRSSSPLSEMLAILVLYTDCRIRINRQYSDSFVRASTPHYDKCLEMLIKLTTPGDSMSERLKVTKPLLVYSDGVLKAVESVNNTDTNSCILAVGYALTGRFDLT